MFLDSVTSILYIYRINPTKLVIDSSVKFMVIEEVYLNLDRLSKSLIEVFHLFKRMVFSHPYLSVIRLNQADYRHQYEDYLFIETIKEIYFWTPRNELLKRLIVVVE